MPFKTQAFLESLNSHVEGAARDELARACESYTALTAPHQKARCIHWMMDVLDREVNQVTRQAILEACGRRCIGAGILEKALRLQKGSQDLDDLIGRLNAAQIGGGHLRREGDVIQATYERCYCGSVSHSRELFSDTYCHCSCGWYRQLFETLLERPVEVELLGSIIQGDERCEFAIRLA